MSKCSVLVHDSLKDMSRDLDKISENIKKEEKKEDICNIPLSDNVKRLEPHVKQRHLKKYHSWGIDPATLIDAKLDPQQC